MNWIKLFFYIIIVSSIVHILWGFYDRYERQAFCNNLLQTALNKENKELLNYIAENEAPGGLCHSKFTGLRLMADVAMIGYGVYWLREKEASIDKGSKQE